MNAPDHILGEISMQESVVHRACLENQFPWPRCCADFVGGLRLHSVLLQKWGSARRGAQGALPKQHIPCTGIPPRATTKALGLSIFFGLVFAPPFMPPHARSAQMHATALSPGDPHDQCPCAATASLALEKTNCSDVQRKSLFASRSFFWRVRLMPLWVRYLRERRLEPSCRTPQDKNPNQKDSRKEAKGYVDIPLNTSPDLTPAARPLVAQPLIADLPRVSGDWRRSLLGGWFLVTEVAT